MERFLKFCMVGGLGFAVDTVSFSLLLVAQLDVVLARLLAFWTAVLATWLGNRHFTFKSKLKRNKPAELVQYALRAHLSGVLNLAVFYTLMTPLGYPLAFVTGIGVGLCSNYFLITKLYRKVEHY